MVVCKFFQQGNCRYGQSCRFDHIYGSKYSYHATAPQPAQAPQAGVTDDQLVNQVLLDVQSALQGGQWVLSCYSPYKEKPNFPGITDLSVEEARLFIYEAKTNNNLDQAVAYMNNLFKEATQKYEQLLQASPTILKVLRSLYRGEIAPSPFTNNTQSSGFSSGGTAATSIFRSAVQGTSVFGQNSANSTPSIFSQNTTNTSPPSVFGQTTGQSSSIFNQSPGFGQNTNSSPGFGQNTNQTSVFGQPSAENAKSIFAQATQNVFGPTQQANVFGPTSPDTAAKSIFAQATQNAFSGSQPAQSTNPASVFGEANQSVFGKPSSPFSQQQDSSPFRPQDPFQQNNPFATATTQNAFQTDNQANDTNIYSDINSLTQEQVDVFRADNFKLGFIPEVPPPYSLCF